MGKIYVQYVAGVNRHGANVEGIPTVSGAIEGLLKAKLIRESDISRLKIEEIKDSCGNTVYRDK